MLTVEVGTDVKGLFTLSGTGTETGTEQWETIGPGPAPVQGVYTTRLFPVSVPVQVPSSVNTPLCVTDIVM